jgi:AcrR family transcriptional regulator
MAEPVKPTGPVDFPRRRARARATRIRVLDAARALFVERGYVATTIDAIAERADVSPETIYARFGNKRTILSDLVDVSIAGDDVAAPILERDWVQAMRDQPDPHRRLRMLAGHGHSILERRAAVDEVVSGAAAADPDIAALRHAGKVQRHAGQRELLRIVVGPGGLRDGLDLDAAADILYAIGSPETYQLLVTDRGWSPARFEAWYGETLDRLLLPPEDDADQAPQESERGREHHQDDQADDQQRP